jgi:protein-S-isoprenylcysteine O-methyltransferase Ste14
MRYVATALVMAAGVAALIVYAAGDDAYYGDGTSRWEHATSSDGAVIVVVALVVASALAVGFLARGLVSTRIRLTPPLLLAVPLYLVSLAFAWFFLSIGH